MRVADADLLALLPFLESVQNGKPRAPSKAVKAAAALLVSDIKASPAYETHKVEKDRAKVLRRAEREANLIPSCTCSVSLAMKGHLPLCPRGLKTGERWATWDEVPNDVLTDELYEVRHGHPPPRCPNHETYGPRLYDHYGGECSTCNLTKRLAAERLAAEEASPVKIDPARPITAKKRSRCSCGTWVNPGDKILWNPETGRTVGCKPCLWEGLAPDHPEDPVWDDAYPIFHD